jgi:hypothetical protein
MTTPDIAGLCERLRADLPINLDVSSAERRAIIQANTDKYQAADTLERQAAEIERLRGAFGVFVEAIKRAPISWETGTCCCGNPVEGHGFGDGHSPVDEGGYFITTAITDAEAALTGEGPRPGRSAPHLAIVPTPDENAVPIALGDWTPNGAPATLTGEDT